jgi:hypothetical protein
MKRDDAIKNIKNDRVGRVSLVVGNKIMICYYNDGNRVYPPWEWLNKSDVMPINDVFVDTEYASSSINYD